MSPFGMSILARIITGPSSSWMRATLHAMSDSQDLKSTPQSVPRGIGRNAYFLSADSLKVGAALICGRQRWSSGRSSTPVKTVRVGAREHCQESLERIGAEAEAEARRMATSTPSGGGRPVGGPRHRDVTHSRRCGGSAGHREPERRFMAPLWHQNKIGYLRCSGRTRFDWWAGKDSNLGPTPGNSDPT